MPDGRSGMLGSRCWAGPVPADSRMTEGQATSEWLTISSSVSRRLTGTGTSDPPVILRHESHSFTAMTAA